MTLRDFHRRYIGPAELERSVVFNTLSVHDRGTEHADTTHSFSRISNLEMLDEIEELELVLGHYAMTWGVKLFSAGDTSFKAAWNDWGVKQKDSMDTGPYGED